MRDAQDQGHADAQFNLGLAYDTGDGMLQDDAEAAHWYRLAADLGIADAQFNLGCMYREGRGVLIDYAEAGGRDDYHADLVLLTWRQEFGGSGR